MVEEHTASMVVARREAASEDELAGKEPHSGRMEELPWGMVANHNLAGRMEAGKVLDEDVEGVEGVEDAEAQSCMAVVA